MLIRARMPDDFMHLLEKATDGTFGSFLAHALKTTRLETDLLRLTNQLARVNF